MNEFIHDLGLLALYTIIEHPILSLIGALILTHFWLKGLAAGRHEHRRKLREQEVYLRKRESTRP